MSARKFPNLENIKELYQKGLNSVQIAKQLNISPVSVRWHYKKLELKAQNKIEAARKYEVAHDYFENVNSEDKAYILGLLYADGCNYISSKEVKIILELIDKDIVFKINNIIQPTKPVIHKIRNTKDTYRICFQSRKMSQDLLKLGMTSNKSLNLTFPIIIEELYPHFIRGFFDGDGGVYVNKHTISVSFISNEEFLIALQNILISLGINKTKILKNTKSSAKYFAFSAKKDIEIFRNWLYKDANLYIQRKHNKLYGKL